MRDRQRNMRRHPHDAGGRLGPPDVRRRPPTIQRSSFASLIYATTATLSLDFAFNIETAGERSWSSTQQEPFEYRGSVRSFPNRNTRAQGFHDPRDPTMGMCFPDLPGPNSDVPPCPSSRVNRPVSRNGRTRAHVHTNESPFTISI